MSSLPPSSAYRKYALRRPRTLFVIILSLVVMALVWLPPTGTVRAARALHQPIIRFSEQHPNATLVSSTIVISQVYGGGGNSGAVYQNDFVELFNLGSTTVSLTGWSVQYASATGTGNFGGNPIAPLSGSLAPGGYYLVKQGSGGANGIALPAPDATGTANMSATAGKIALVNTTTGLVCNGGSTPCPASELAKIVDLVGYGNANFFEGAGAAPTLSATTAGFRGNDGCTETDNNSTDFAPAAPSPRNTGDDIHTCGGLGNPSGVGAANPNSLAPGGSTLLTVSVTPGTSPPSTGVTVTGNLTGIGGSAAQQFFDDGTNGDVTGGDNVFSWQAIVVAGTTGGLKTLHVSISDAQARTGSTNISLTVQAPANPAVTGAANPSTVAQDGSVILTGNVTSGLLPASTGIAVTADLSAIGGSANQQFYDDATHGDAVAGNNVFTFQTIVPAVTTTGGKSIPITVTDAQARSGSGTISLNVTGPAGPHDPSEHLVMGNPNGATADVNFPDNYLMMKLQYALSYNNSRRIPNWTSWHLDSSWRGSAARQDDYRNDVTLPPGFNQVLGTDYSGSGFDRGHMCPSADRTSSVPDNSATFLMTNMVPQAPGNNQGPWAVLENDLRALLPNSEVYIVSGGSGVGGVGSNGAASVLPSGVTVPQKTWKVALILPVGDNDVSRV
ncbi:MAG: DNA/RNA non-specific endonuclease, partial [Acidobacteriota bacterium]|nr:DNA/RNA non-specific endonuclease [Acidobacteriota bacterium]